MTKAHNKNTKTKMKTEKIKISYFKILINTIYTIYIKYYHISSY